MTERRPSIGSNVLAAGCQIGTDLLRTGKGVGTVSIITGPNFKFFDRSGIMKELIKQSF